MKRRKQLMALALVLLPSMIGIVALSVIHLAGGAPPPASPAAAPAGNKPAAMDSPPAAIETPSELPESSPSDPASSPAAPPAFNATESQPSESEDLEERPLVPTTMLAHNVPQPSFASESFGSGPGFRGGYSRRSGGSSGIGGFGVAGSGAAGGSGSGAEPGDTEDHIERLPVDNDSTGGRVQSEPTLPEPDLDTPGDGGQDPQPEGPGSGIVIPGGGDTPSNTLTTVPDEWMKPIDDTGYDIGETGTAPTVSVPEPSTWGLFAIGLLGAAMSARRRSRAV